MFLHPQQNNLPLLWTETIIKTTTNQIREQVIMWFLEATALSTTQLLHLSVREHCGCVDRKIIRVKGTEYLLWDSVSWKCQRIYTYEDPTSHLVKQDLSKGDTNWHRRGIFLQDPNPRQITISNQKMPKGGEIIFARKRLPIGIHYQIVSPEII